MTSQYVLLALLIAAGHDAVVGHIVTTSHVDIPLLFCMKNLRSAVHVLCNFYDRSDESLESSMPLSPQELAREVAWDRLARTCCLRPCAVAELLSVC